MIFFGIGLAGLFLLTVLALCLFFPRRQFVIDIPDDLNNQIEEIMERKDIDISQFFAEGIAWVILEHQLAARQGGIYIKPAGEDSLTQIIS